jgi:hypothetical protein
MKYYEIQTTPLNEFHSFINSNYGSDFDSGMIVSARRAGSSISETSGLLGFSCMRDSRVYREWFDNQKTSLQWPSCGQKSAC